MIVVVASDKQWNELTATRPHVEWQRAEHAEDFDQYKNADAFFCLQADAISTDLGFLKKPVFINSVIATLSELNLPPHVFRINGWAGFLQRPVWEVAGLANEEADLILQSLQVTASFVKDEPGFISARVIAMIINEAYFALEDEVSSKAEIDTAMKLGTNYPLGPFEWALQIGVENVSALLQKLSSTDSRYKPSQLLLKEAAEKK